MDNRSYSWRRSVLLVACGIVLGVFFSVTWQTYDSAAQSGGCRSFAQTGHKVCGRFLTYWQQNGGLAQQGYPLSEEFVETNPLNGRPYTVQYFERAVFELHPENKAPYDVLLSQLGTYLGKASYTQGFPAAAGQTPFYEQRAEAVETLKSYYNAVNRKEYERAYSYFRGAPNPLPGTAPPYQQFVAGYADTASVTLAHGQPFLGAAAGNLYSSLPVVLVARHTDGREETFAGCYVLHRANDGVSPDPRDVLWSIESAQLSTVPNNPPLDALLARNCAP